MTTEQWFTDFVNAIAGVEVAPEPQITDVPAARTHAAVASMELDSILGLTKG